MALFCMGEHDEQSGGTCFDVSAGANWPIQSHPTSATLPVPVGKYRQPYRDTAQKGNCFSCLSFQDQWLNHHSTHSWESLLETMGSASINIGPIGPTHVQAGSSPCTTWTSLLWALVVARWPCSCWPTLPWQLPAFPLRPSPRGIPWANGWAFKQRTRRHRLAELDGMMGWVRTSWPPFFSPNREIPKYPLVNVYITGKSPYFLFFFE